MAAMTMDRAVGQDQFQPVPRFEFILGLHAQLGEPPRPLEVDPLVDREAHPDGVRLRDIVQHDRVGFPADELADLGLGYADTAVYRRVNPGIAELDVRLFDLRLGGLYRTLCSLVFGHGGVEILLADGLHLRQWTYPGKIALRLGKHGAGLRKPALRLDNLCLEGTRIDGVEQLVLADLAAFHKFQAFQKALDPGADRDIDRATRRTNQLDGDRDIFLNNADNRYIQYQLGRLLLVAAGQSGQNK
jgi:hypothetical protein